MSSRNTNRAIWKKKPASAINNTTSHNKDQQTQRNSNRNKLSKTSHKEKKIMKQEKQNKTEQWISDNLEEQKSEFQSIKDIYSDEIIVINEPSSYHIKIINDEDKSQEILLEIKYPIQYPAVSPPIYSISTSYLKQIPKRTEIENKFKSIWNENKGQCIMFEWISELKEYASIIFTSNNNDNDYDDQVLINELLYNNIDRYCSIPIDEQRHRLSLCPDIIFCDRSICDRKSLFKSYAARVGDIQQIKAFIDKLKSNKKIANATHNMIGYRLSSSSSGIINEHYDDDGEHGGGKVILEILRKRNIVDVVIMVTRWYGGIHLSSDRFKHIKSMTQYVLEEGKFESNAKYIEKYKQKKPKNKDIELSKNICNRLYWSKDIKFERRHLYIGCKCKDKKLNDVIEFNLEEYGIQKSGIQWVEYVSYKGLLIWDICGLSRTFEELSGTMQNM